MRRLGNFLLIFLVVVITFFAVTPSLAQAPAWQPNTPYAVNALVSYGGSTYKCLQAHTSQIGWEPPNVPALWQLQSGTPLPATNTPTRTNTPLPTASSTNTTIGPTATRTNTPTITRTSTPTATSGSGCSASAWSSTAIYTNGDQASYGGHLWQAKWWTQGDTPGGSAGVWTDLGVCGTVPTATRTATATNTLVPTFQPPTTAGPSATPTRTATTGPTQPPGKHIIIGYWHNFDNGSGFIPLTQVSNNFDIINVSFAEPGPNSPNGEMVFVPYNRTTAEFQSDIAVMHSRGKKVLISVGGYVGSTFTLNTPTATTNFINSMQNIISTYGFDGMDIDWEQNVLILAQGDTSITNPTSPTVVNTITAITTIRNHFGSNFMLTYGMETFFVQLGYQFYGGTCLGCDRRAGSLLPVIYATRGFTNYVAVQLYNSGSIMALDNNYYTNGGPDFLVAMTDMLLRGFPVAGTGQTFPALSPSQIAVGVPATSSAGNGYVAPAQLQQAFNYLARGISYGGAYRMANSSGYPTLAGFMTWSVNWDQLSGFSFSNPIRSYLNSIP